MSSLAIAVGITTGCITAWIIRDRLQRWWGNRGSQRQKIMDAQADMMVEELKNALLTSALALTGRFDNAHDYWSTSNADNNGNPLLPPLYGDSITSACFSYISRDKQMTKSDRERQHAIRLYLRNHFYSRNETIAFFEEFFWLAATSTADATVNHPWRHAT